MKVSKNLMHWSLLLASAFIYSSCESFLQNELPANAYGMDDKSVADEEGGGENNRLGKPGGGDSRVGNNLSFPVIWSEGVAKTLRQPPAGYTTDTYKIGGDWWYVWGEDPIDPEAPLYSCYPVNEGDDCYGTFPPSDLFKAFIQKDINNYWQAYAGNATEVMNVDFIDWGDNLESVPWTLSSKVRTEVVLNENLPVPVREYAMRHVYGWGTDELHGLQATPGNNPEVIYGPGTQATVFSPHARLTIQKLVSENPELTWDASAHAWIGSEVLSPVFNKAVWEAADGPSYYNAEINVKGKMIYGYTWDVKKQNNGAGIYRITFSFDGTAPASTLNTYFDSNTQVLLPVEVALASEETGGGTAYIDVANNLTYIDVVILSGKGGGSNKEGN